MEAPARPVEHGVADAYPCWLLNMTVVSSIKILTGTSDVLLTTLCCDSCPFKVACLLAAIELHLHTLACSNLRGVKLFYLSLSLLLASPGCERLAVPLDAGLSGCCGCCSGACGCWVDGSRLLYIDKSCLACWDFTKWLNSSKVIAVPLDFAAGLD